MTLDEVKKQFLQQIKLRAYDDKYIDKAEEREILQFALTAGVELDSARSSLAQVCEQNNYVLESTALQAVKEMLAIQAGNDGKIDEKEFNDALSLLKVRTQGKKPEPHLKKMLCQMIDENSYKVKTGMFSNWYKRVKSEVGL
jgi:hypothetical protein